MHIPKFWAKAEHDGVQCFRWSDRSIADAKSLALDAAKTLHERLRQGLIDNAKRDSYGYGSAPLREEVIKEIDRDRGELTAAITRNSYGCAVLNCTNVLFVDVDLEEKKPEAPSGGLFSLLFGNKTVHAAAPSGDEALRRVQQVIERTGAARVYRTKAGLRILFTHDEFNPKDSDVDALFESFGADPLYVRLCKLQESFRARLTPKPWRMDGAAAKPPCRWPFDDARAESRFKGWLEEYDRAAAGYATCELVGAFGSGRTKPAIAKIVTIHDELTKVNSGLPLA